jgi:hypothetical protein
VSGDFERSQVYHGDVVVRGAGYEGADSVRLHQNTSRASTDFQALALFARGGVEDYQVGAVQGGDEDEFSVRGEFQAVGALDVGVENGDDFFAWKVEDGDGSVLSVGAQISLPSGEM